MVCDTWLQPPLRPLYFPFLDCDMEHYNCTSEKICLKIELSLDDITKKESFQINTTNNNEYNGF